MTGCRAAGMLSAWHSDVWRMARAWRSLLQGTTATGAGMHDTCYVCPATPLEASSDKCVGVQVAVHDLCLGVRPGER